MVFPYGGEEEPRFPDIVKYDCLTTTEYMAIDHFGITVPDIGGSCTTIVSFVVGRS